MALGGSLALVNFLMDAGFNSVAYDGPTQFFVKLHSGGEPGAAGTSNPASETDRIEVTFSASVGGVISNEADITWTAVAGTGTQTYTHYSLWTASSGGTFMFSGALTGTGGAQAQVAAGGDFTIDAGALDIALLGVAA